jgi:hypothetical protein
VLKQVLDAIETATGPVHVGELSQRLGVERSALEGMIAYWVRKGRLLDSDAAGTACVPTIGHCGASCTGVMDCVFIAKMPKSYSVSP